MTNQGLPNDDRLIELLALRAAEGLPAEREEELGSWASCDDLDEAAAILAIGMAVEGGLEDMPQALRERLGAAAQRGGAQNIAGKIATGGIEAKPAARTERPGTESRRMLWAIATVGWLAAAACVAFLLVVRSPEQAPTLPQRLARLGSKPGTVTTPWLGLDDAELSETPHAYDQSLSGEVVWDPETNEGYMVFEGLGTNDPGVYQYQLWIFDADRPVGELPQYGDGILSQRPVDGGVFDAPGGRVIVPIDAKLRVGQAAAFAITVEPPGGVVVSDRDIVALALVK